MAAVGKLVVGAGLQKEAFIDKLKPEFFGVFGFYLPANLGAAGYGQIAGVLEGFVLFARVGGIVELEFEIEYYGFGNNADGIFFGAETVCPQVERLVFLQVFKGVVKYHDGFFGEFVFVAGRNQIDFVGDLVAGEFHVKLKILLLHGLQIGVEHHETERSLFFEKSGVVDDAVRRLGYYGRRNDEYDHQNEGWRQNVFEVFFVDAKIDGSRERNGRELPDFLVDGGFEQFGACRVLGRDSLQLKRVEKFVAHLGEETADDAGCLLVGDGFADAKQAENGYGHEPPGHKKIYTYI